MPLYYSPEIKNNNHLLNKEESWHIAKVLRSRTGDIIQLTDGTGNIYEAQLVQVNPISCEVIILKTTRTHLQKSSYLHIAIAPTKNIDRFEWFLEKATEIGIEEITPLICDHSERKIVKLNRLEKVMISAMKQSLKAFLPLLNEPLIFNNLIQHSYPGQKFIAYCETGKGDMLHKLYQKGKDAIILIGPEGDFSPAEVESAKKMGFIPVSLGESRLRTETAGIVACQTINLMNS